MIPLIMLLILSGCHAGGSGQQLALDIRSGLLKASSIAITADVTADYGDRVYQFIFTYTGNGAGGTLEILSPKNIAGVKAKVTVTGGTISYDGAELDTGKLTGDGLSPAESVPVLLDQWRTGYISGCNYETLGNAEALAVTTEVTQTVRQRTWFDVKTHLPLRSEFAENGRMVVAASFRGVVIK